MDQLLFAALIIETIFFLVCILELRDTRRRLGELPTKERIVTPNDTVWPNTSQTMMQRIAISSRLFYTAFLAAFVYKDKDKATKDLVDSFNKAKIISDFIGMITRLGVMFFLYTFVVEKLKSASTYFETAIYVLSSGSILSLYLYFLYLIQNVILHYHMREVSVFKSVRIRLLLLISNALFLYSIYKVLADVTTFLSASGKQPHS